LLKLFNMYFLLLSIVSSSLIIVVFKLIGRYRANTLSAIIINYPVACIAGFFLANSSPISELTESYLWFYIAAFLGVLFIGMFWLIGTSTIKAGISITTVAAKMSVIIPITYSIWIDPNDSLSIIKLSGILLAIAAVLMAVYKKGNGAQSKQALILPLSIFVGLGIMDSIVKYSQLNFLTSSLTPIFTASSFGFAFVVGLLILPFNHSAAKDMLKLKSWIIGIPLGLLNFGSMYFLIRALAHINIESNSTTVSSIIFGINNISIVALSVLIGFTIFKERPTKLNWVGICLSGVAIIILAYS